jgi:peptide/nickel transport system ATP-binding protein
MREALLEIRGLAVEFATARGTLPAVRDVSLALGRGEILGLVGESGCGKSVTALSILRLLPAGARIAAGQVLFAENGRTAAAAPASSGHEWVEARDLTKLSEEELRQVRGARISMIFQEPMTALNPVMQVGEQIGEALVAHGLAGKREARAAALEMMRQVAIPDAERRIRQYPHQLSGGLRQRVMIAMALVCRPLLLIADEPTTALDVTIQAQILALLAEQRQRLGLALLFISHDLGVVAQIADRVAVMYAGRIVEHGPVRDIFAAPAHPYTCGLLRAAPSLASQPRRRLATIEGMVPNPAELPPGCSFEPRCELRVPECRAAVPELIEVSPGHYARCIRTGLTTDAHG